MNEQPETGAETTGKFFTIVFEGEEIRLEKATWTGAELMERLGVPIEVGLVQVLEDGTLEPIKPDDVVELKPGRRVGRQPQFRRG